MDINDHASVQTHLWDQIEKRRVGMLGLVGAQARHFQPMTAFLERADNRIWFFTYKDVDLALEAAGGAEAMFVFQDAPRLFACLGGQIRTELDRERMERFWNAEVAAWYPEGKDDPRLTLLRLDARDAEVWLTEAGPARFAWEIAKANATRSQPDLGEHTRLNLH